MFLASSSPEFFEQESCARAVNRQMGLDLRIILEDRQHAVARILISHGSKSVLMADTLPPLLNVAQADERYSKSRSLKSELLYETFSVLVKYFSAQLL